MTTPNIIHVSPHVLMDALSCETRWWTRHHKGFTSVGDAIKAVAGQAFHAAVAVVLDPMPTTNRREAALSTFHAIYDPAFARMPPEKMEPSLAPSNLHRVLDRWIEMHPQSLLPWRRVLMVEEAFVSREFIIDGVTVKLIVRPDLVVEGHDDKIRFVDTKTTGWRIGDESWKRALRLSLQVQLYADAVVQKFGDKALFGGWINAIELRQLPGAAETATKLKKDGTPAKPPQCKEHGRPYIECGNEHAKAEFIECLTTPERVDRAVKDAYAGCVKIVNTLSADALHGENVIPLLSQFGGANGTCRFCPSADWCEAGRPYAALGSFLEYSPWPVEEGKRE